MITKTSPQTQENKHAVEPPVKPGILRRVIRGLLMYLLPPIIVAGGVFGAYRLITTAPTVERRPPVRQATLVNVQRPARISTRAQLQVMGTVVPSQRVMLHPRVSGEVVELNPKFIPGGRFEAGEFILKIDPEDYELAVERAASEIAQAEYEHKLEQGHQEIAQREWELLDMKEEASELDRELALRRPHLLKAEARLKAARAAKREAELALERTTVRAPFSCAVESENIDVGAQVTPQTQLGTLVGTEAYWVQAAVPVDQLRWIRFPNENGQGGSQAVIRQELGTGVQGEWQGQVVRLLSDLEPQGRMARVLVSVPDPLRLDDEEQGLPLLIDAYVNVTIEGREIEDVIELPRSAVRQANAVWIMNGDEELEIRKVDIIQSDRDRVLVRSGIDEGDRVIVSDLSAPVAGMALAEMNGDTGFSSPDHRVAMDSAGDTPADGSQ